jgi:hypothetical protein
MSSNVSHSIKSRKIPKDVFYTPKAVAQTHISLIPTTDEEVWYDPFRGNGAYYNQFPAANPKEWCELLRDRNFFTPLEYMARTVSADDPHVSIPMRNPDVICSNPPFSILDRVLQHSIDLKPRIISYLLLHGAMTPKRMELLNRAGYGLVAIYTCKVYAWYGMAEAYVFERGKDNDSCRIRYDRIVHRLTDEESAAQQVGAEKYAEKYGD